MSQGGVGKREIKRRGPKCGNNKILFGIFQSVYRREVAGYGVTVTCQCKDAVHLTFNAWRSLFHCFGKEHTPLFLCPLFPFLEVESSDETVLVLMSWNNECFLGYTTPGF